MRSKEIRPRALRCTAALFIYASVLGILVGGPDRQLWASDLSFKAGLGYEFLSQEFFLDSTSDLTGADSLLTDWELSSTYLDDLKGQLSLTYIDGPRRDFEVRLHYDQTDEFIRARLNARKRIQLGGSDLDWDGELESKQRYRGESDFGDSYLEGYGSVKMTSPLISQLSLVTRLRADGVRFRDVGEYSYNYYRATGKVGLQYTFANFSFADLRFYGTTRQVPDSAELDYYATGVEASFFGFHSAGDGDLTVRLEQRDYQREEDRDDHTDFELHARHRINFSPAWFAAQEIRTELVDFGAADPINFDYTRIEFRLQAGWELDQLTLALGPEAEFFAEQQQELADGEDYTEFGLVAEVDWLHLERGFGSIEASLGSRRLDTETEYQTNFAYRRLSLIGDVSLVGELTLSLLLSAEWEAHEKDQDNSRILLLSTSLVWEF